MATKIREHAGADQEADVAAWADAQASTLRNRRADALDWDKLAEEIADGGSFDEIMTRPMAWDGESA